MGIIGTPQLLDDNASIDDSYSRSYSRTYLVWATSDFSAYHVRNGLGIGIAATHPDDSGALCKNIAVTLATPNLVAYDSVQNPGGASSPPANGTKVYMWRAEVQWGRWNPLEHTGTGDPVDQPTQVFFESQTFEEIADYAYDGSGNVIPVANSAFSPFDPPVMRDRTRPILRVVRNEATFSDSTILAYADKVNSDVVQGVYQERTLKCSAPTAEKQFSQFTGAEYYKVTYILQFKPDTWDKKILDAGFEELDPSDATKRRKILVEGIPASSPQLLDGSGHALAAPVDHTNVNYVTLQVYETIDFASSFGFATGIFN